MNYIVSLSLRHTTHDTIFCKDCLDFYRGKHSVPVAGLNRLSESRIQMGTTINACTPCKLQIYK
uniref:Uncharacterized protein n=1 Tax=Amphimedon queenslandica TaxID=400682 RepID=A0A1X7V9Z6_AMPQE